MRHHGFDLGDSAAPPRKRQQENTNKMVSFCIVFDIQVYEGEDKLDHARA